MYNIPSGYDTSPVLFFPRTMHNRDFQPLARPLTGALRGNFFINFYSHKILMNNFYPGREPGLVSPGHWRPGHNFILDLTGYDMVAAEKALREVDITNYRDKYPEGIRRPLRDFGDFVVMGRKNGGIVICAWKQDQARLAAGLRRYLESIRNGPYDASPAGDFDHMPLLQDEW
jgi:hypothetical protein